MTMEIIINSVVSFLAEQDPSYLYVGVHTQLRQHFQRRILLETCIREEAL
jgi:hypothetical protein